MRLKPGHGEDVGGSYITGS